MSSKADSADPPPPAILDRAELVTALEKMDPDMPVVTEDGAMKVVAVQTWRCTEQRGTITGLTCRKIGSGMNAAYLASILLLRVGNRVLLDMEDDGLYPVRFVSVVSGRIELLGRRRRDD